MATHGGRRTGSGRKKGSVVVRSTKETKAIAKKLERLPLEMMMEAAEFAYKDGGAAAAFPFARECAPYLHPKRQPVDDKGSARITVERVFFGEGEDESSQQ